MHIKIRLTEFGALMFHLQRFIQRLVKLVKIFILRFKSLRLLLGEEEPDMNTLMLTLATRTLVDPLLSSNL